MLGLQGPKPSQVGHSVTREMMLPALAHKQVPVRCSHGKSHERCFLVVTK